MQNSKTLEEDILLIISTNWRPLTLDEIWEKLADEGVIVPIRYLAKVVTILVEVGFLKLSVNQRNIACYGPTSFFSRFKPVRLVTLVRTALRLK